MCLRYLLGFMLLFSAWSWALHGAPVPGVTVTYRTVSCCDVLNIPIDEGCLNTFLIGDRNLGLVNRTEIDVRKPFHFLPDERMMQLLDCVPFVHQSICDVGKIWQMETIVNYQVTLCYKQDGAPNAATVIRGSDLCLFFAVALLVAKFY